VDVAAFINKNEHTLIAVVTLVNIFLLSYLLLDSQRWLKSYLKWPIY